MLPLSPQEEQDLKALSFWVHYHQNGRQRYIQRIRLAVSGMLYLAKRNGTPIQAQAIPDDDLVHIISGIVLPADHAFSQYLRSKSHLQYQKWPIVLESFARMVVSDARADILVGL